MNPPSSHKSLGTKGEKLARDFFVKKGYTILHTNWIFTHKEVDIIAESKEFVIFAEVKTRRSFVATDNLMEIIPRKKMKYLLKAAQAYIDKFNIIKEVRFDVILIHLKANRHEIIHIEDAFNAII